MSDKVVSNGDIALIRIGTLYASVVIRQAGAGCVTCGYNSVLVELLDTGERCLLPRTVLVGLCDNVGGCHDAVGRCRHCGQRGEDAHKVGCPHDMADECDAHPAESEEGADGADG